MSLTREDLLEIRSIVEGVVQREIAPIRGEIEALRNDIKEIYDMITKLDQPSVLLNESFERLTDEEKILQLHAAVTTLARQRGIALPQ